MKAVLVMDSPLGALQLTAVEDGLTALSFLDDAKPPTAADTPLLQRAREQLQAYFSGDAITFDLPLRPQGTPFQQAVWRALQTVPYGQTISYALLAQRLGLPASHARAVGAAVGRNPLLIIVPCHRIIGHDGSSTGYAAGLPRKQALLDLERAA
ncbi:MULTISPECIES: methylated-DNA--[protein]-cysteine S-methyltransferase [Thiomonas]|uniref:methylated-DNA--[protein]-cysteine S-methyltransferase n=1 Tax=Thiomonas TaxID=32012 RepID=UPI001AD1FB4D|nr:MULTISPECIES: methylated-DNA--[protein]-cysteine S-methyltransferase [Thiomonas]MBN8776086.1 methylated-DNA--[protein]-cysteine S-methyltransferase [Thiomonas arsenitoxydans]MDE2267495.1 methylated-DNA--[protein]-cysteine S-methyltransferase [Betaproteobacteria bacterium]HML80677.1 methylated-DNA--[protein]-cysteine S-methyltransferase [Thiomonas arsenitoxydans]